VIVLPSYCDALTGRPAGRPSQRLADSHAAYSEHCSAGDCALHGMCERWLQRLGEVGRAVVP